MSNREALKGKLLPNAVSLRYYVAQASGFHYSICDHFSFNIEEFFLYVAEIFLYYLSTLSACK